MAILKEFKKFILRGNVMDLAIGVVIGAAFNGVVQALVKDILTPLIGAIYQQPDFSSLTVTLHGSQFFYGDFLNSLISFIIVAFAVYFFVVLPMNRFMNKFNTQPAEPPKTKKCLECLSEIPVEAKRCAFCAQPVA